MCYMKVHPEKEVPAWEDPENSRIVHKGCLEHWRDDLRMGELIKCFDPFDLASKKIHQKKKKENKTVQFKNEDPKNKLFCKNHGTNTTHNTNKCRLEASERGGQIRDNHNNFDRDRCENASDTPRRRGVDTVIPLERRRDTPRTRRFLRTRNVVVVVRRKNYTLREAAKNTVLAHLEVMKVVQIVLTIVASKLITKCFVQTCVACMSSTNE